jgi:hypothetical protein
MVAVAMLSFQFCDLLLQLVDQPHYFIVEQAGQLRLTVQARQCRPHIALGDGLGEQVSPLGKMPPE